MLVLRWERRVVAAGDDPRGGVVVCVREGVRRREDVLVVEAVVAQRGAARGRGVPRQRLAVGDPAASVARTPRHRRGNLLQRLLVRLHGDRSIDRACLRVERVFWLWAFGRGSRKG